MKSDRDCIIEVIPGVASTRPNFIELLLEAGLNGYLHDSLKQIPLCLAQENHDINSLPKTTPCGTASILQLIQSKHVSGFCIVPEGVRSWCYLAPGGEGSRVRLRQINHSPWRGRERDSKYGVDFSEFLAQCVFKLYTMLKGLSLSVEMCVKGRVYPLNLYLVVVA